MKRYAVLLLMLVPQLVTANLNETDSDDWQVSGLAHYVRSKENPNFVAQLVSVGRNPTVIAFTNVLSSCFGDGGDRKKIKIFYQWVNVTQHCWNGDEYWIPTSQAGIDFVTQKFMSYYDVEAVFDGRNITFSTKNFISIKQSWENTSRTANEAL